MRITFISEYFPYHDSGDITGGVESRCFNIARELAKKHEVRVITSWKKGQKREHILEKINISRVGINHKYSNIGSIFSRLIFSLSAYNKSKKINSEIIEGYNFTSYLPAYYSAKEKNAKSIATYHETWKGEWIKNKGVFTGSLGEIWERITLSKKWNKIISVSKYTKKRIISKTPKKDIIIIHNGINTEEYFDEERKYEKPTICCISRLTEKKRVKDVVLAIDKLKKDIPNIQGIVIGQGPEEKKIKELINKLNLNLNINLTGYVKEHKDVIKYLKKSHIFCLPSVLEGFGIVIIESSACKVPYVCTNIEVLKEVTKNEKGGLFFNQKNPEDLYEKSLELLSNKELYIKKRKEAFELAKNYDWKEIAKKIEKLYLKLLK